MDTIALETISLLALFVFLYALASFAEERSRARRKGREQSKALVRRIVMKLRNESLRAKVLQMPGNALPKNHCEHPGKHVA